MIENIIFSILALLLLMILVIVLIIPIFFVNAWAEDKFDLSILTPIIVCGFAIIWFGTIVGVIITLIGHCK